MWSSSVRDTNIVITVFIYITKLTFLPITLFECDNLSDLFSKVVPQRVPTMHGARVEYAGMIL